MSYIITEFGIYITGVIFAAVISVIVAILYTRKFEVILAKIFRNHIGTNSSRNISGLWVTQYKYPSMSSTGEYFEKIETQIVHFKQLGNYVMGRTCEAEAHPEVFEGRITLDRYFTGIYMNTINHQNYHGAFQFVISNGKGRMKGKWIGFDNKGTEINVGSWRWQQINCIGKLSAEDVHKTKQEFKGEDLFDNTRFLM